MPVKSTAMSIFKFLHTILRYSSRSARAEPPCIRRLLGMAGFYRDFIPNFSTVVEPLTRLTKKGAQFTWGDEQEQATATLKLALEAAPILRHPDWNRPFILSTDWSVVGVGAVLSQEDDDGKRHVIAYASRTNNSHERNLSPYEGELLAIVWAVQKWNHYLSGRRFIIETDHASLAWLLTSSDLTPQLARWALKLSEYTSWSSAMAAWSRRQA